MPIEEYTLHRQQWDFQDSLPVPLEERMGCAVSLAQDLPAPNDILVQTGSTLCATIPAELRLVIWEYAIGRQTIHIVHKYRRLGHAVCDTEYWTENRAERPNLRASSYMYTYGSLPPTKQLADWNMCSLLLTCRKIHEETATLLYTSNTFVFWDLRTINVFRRGIHSCRWEAIQSVEIYAMCYRADDIEETTRGKSRLQLEAWPLAIAALATLPHLRHMRVFVGNTLHLDPNYINGRRSPRPHASTIAFLERLQELGIGSEIFMPLKRKRSAREQCKWNLHALKDMERLRLELKDKELDCSVSIGDIWMTVDQLSVR